MNKPGWRHPNAVEHFFVGMRPKGFDVPWVRCNAYPRAMNEMAACELAERLRGESTTIEYKALHRKVFQSTFVAGGAR